MRPRFDDWAGFTDQGNFWHAADCDYVTQNLPCTCPTPEGMLPYQPRQGHEGISNPVHLTTEIFPQKIDTILQAQSPDQPFCLSVSFKAPHAPFQDWDERFAEDYRTDLPTRPTVSLEEAERQPQFLRESLEHEFGQRVVETPKELQTWMRHYYRLIAGIDLAVGEIVASLKTHGLDQNTIIIFTSDNGFLLGEHGLWGKWLMHEESIRVPMIIVDPRRPQTRGQTSPRMALSLDLAPTILDLANLPIPEVMQGQSLVPLLDNPQAPFRSDWFYEHLFSPPEPRRIESTEGVRTDRWKYIRYIRQEPIQEQLFDLETDPYETQNLLGEPNHAKTLAALRQRWADLAKEIRE